MSSIMEINNGSMPVQTIINDIVNYSKRYNMRDGIDLQPSYQRAYIWNSDFKDKLLYSLIRRYPIGNICLRVRQSQNQRGAMREVVDGQQRLTTIYNFMKGGNEGKGEEETAPYVIQSDISRKIIEYVVEYMGDDDDPKLLKLKQRLNNRAKIALSYSDLPEPIQRNINSYPIALTIIANASDDAIAEYFRFLQNQERLRAGEIINSLPETALEKYLKKISDITLLLDKLSFQSDRRQFDRIFYSILGLLDGQLAFGVVDKEIISFVSACKELNSKTLPAVDCLIAQLNAITADSSIPSKYVSFKKARAMKFLLLLSAFNLVDFRVDTKKKLKALESIDDKLSSFSSAKADQLKRTFHGYSPEVIEEYRLMALISNRRHTFQRVKNRMDILAYYVNDFSNQILPSGIRPI